jgi:hypothetical protein
VAWYEAEATTTLGVIPLEARAAALDQQACGSTPQMSLLQNSARLR